MRSKRARDARLPENLGGEGFLILGHQDADPHIARILGLPVPDKGELVSCRVIPAEKDTVRRVWLGDGWWRLAGADEESGPGPDRDVYLRLSRQVIKHGPAD